MVSSWSGQYLSWLLTRAMWPTMVSTFAHRISTRSEIACATCNDCVARTRSAHFCTSFLNCWTSSQDAHPPAKCLVASWAATHLLHRNEVAPALVNSGGRSSLVHRCAFKCWVQKAVEQPAQDFQLTLSRPVSVVLRLEHPL